MTWSSMTTAHAPAAGASTPTLQPVGARLAAAVACLAVLGWAATGLLEMAAEGPAAPPSTKAEARPPVDTSRLPPGRETFVGAYIGAPYTYPSDVTLKQPGVHDFTAKDVAWDGEPFKDPIYYGARVARWGAGGFGGMVDFTHSKTLARLKEEARVSGTLDGKPVPQGKRLDEIYRRLEFSHGHNMLTLNGLYRLPRPHARVQPYTGLGIGVNLPHTEVQLISGGKRTYEYQATGSALQAVIGVEFRVPRMSYFVEYKFTLASYAAPLTGRDGDVLPLDIWRQVRDWWAGIPAPGGVLTTRLTSHQVIAGLGVRLDATPGAVAP